MTDPCKHRWHPCRWFDADVPQRICEDCGTIEVTAKGYIEAITVRVSVGVDDEGDS